MPTTATGVPWGGTPPPAAVTSASGIKYEWRIVALDYTIADGKVSQIHWTLNATNGNQSAGAYGSIGASSLNTPFSALTEQRVVDYVKTDFGSRASDLEKSLAAQIAEKMTPTTATGVPWGGTPPPAAVTSASGIKYEWRIVALDYTIADGKVSQIHWTLNATNGNQSAGAYGSIGASSLNTPFSALTEQRVVDYVKTDFGSRASDLEKSLAAQIAEKMTPTTATGVLSFKNAPDYENPTDYPNGGASVNNYVVTISATNSSGSVSYHTIAVQVQNVPESSDGSPGSSSSGSGSSGSIPPVTDVSPTTPAQTPATPPTTPVLGFQPQETVTTAELSTPIVLGNLEVTKAVVGTIQSDIITGSSAAEALSGGLGKDQITGGKGPDAFIFERAGEFGKDKYDTITDFSRTDGDKVVISREAFNGVTKVILKTVSGNKGLKTASKSTSNFIYNRASGILYFDSNGKKSGWGDGGEFAQLLGAPQIGKSDFVLI